MKKIVLSFLILTSILANAQNINALDDKYGYGNLHFEDSISLFQTMKQFDQTKDSQFRFYRKADETLVINNANVDIIYTFFKGQFSTVLIKSLDSLGSRQVLRHFQKLYGLGKQNDPYLQNYFWNGRLVLLSYYENVNTLQSNIFISSIKMKLKYEGRDKY